MEKPKDFSLQCPSCHMQTTTNVCGAGRRRMNQTTAGEFFKNIDCPMWIECVIKEKPTEVRTCPTCGQMIMVPTLQPTDKLSCVQPDVNVAMNNIIDNIRISSNVILSNVSAQTEGVIESTPFDWDDNPTIPVDYIMPTNVEPTEPIKIKRHYKPRGRGFKDMPRSSRPRKNIGGGNERDKI